MIEAHQFAIARQHGKWKVLDSPELKQAKTEIQKLNEELEQKVIERTNELAKANEELRLEISGRKRAEEEKTKLRAQFLQAQKLESVGRLAGGMSSGLSCRGGT